MPEEIYDIQINFNADTDGAIDDISDLESELGDFDDEVDDVDETSRRASGGLDDVQRSLRGNFLPFLTGSALVGGLVGGFAALAAQSASVQNFFDTATAGASRFFDAAFGEEVEQVAQDVNRVFAAESARQEQQRELGERGVLGDIAGLFTYFSGELARQTEAAVEQGRQTPIEAAIRQFFFGDFSSLFEQPNPPALAPTSDTNTPAPVNFDTFSRQPETPSLAPVIAPVADTPAPPALPQVLPGYAGAGAGYGSSVVIQQTFTGDIVDQTAVEQMVQRGIQSSFSNPQFRGSTLTGGGIP